MWELIQIEHSKNYQLYTSNSYLILLLRSSNLVVKLKYNDVSTWYFDKVNCFVQYDQKYESMNKEIFKIENSRSVKNAKNLSNIRKPSYLFKEILLEVYKY